jgi:hypothetical protein
MDTPHHLQPNATSPLQSQPRTTQLFLEQQRVHWISPLFDTTAIDDIFSRIRSLMALRMSKRFEVSVSPNGDSYSDQIYTLQNELFHLSSSAESTTVLEKCCCLAATIYILVGLCDMSFHARLVETTAERLCRHAEQVAEEMLFVGSKDDCEYMKLFWPMTIGCIALGLKEQRHSLINLMKTVSELANCGTALHKNDLLRRVAWDTAWDKYLPPLWNEIDNFEVP